MVKCQWLTNHRNVQYETSTYTRRNDIHNQFVIILINNIQHSRAETTKANNLKPYEYFEYLLTKILAHMDDTDSSFLEDLLS